MQLPTTAPAQAAFAVPKRNLKLAVDRNRMKRLMREAYRLEKGRLYERTASLTGQAAWLFIYQGKALIGQEETRDKISRALDRWFEKHG